MTDLLGLTLRLEALRAGRIEPSPQGISDRVGAMVLMYALNDLSHTDKAIPDGNTACVERQTRYNNGDAGYEQYELTTHGNSSHIVGST
jgi:hypothetical protein